MVKWKWPVEESFVVAWGWGSPDSVSLPLFLPNCSKVSTEVSLVRLTLDWDWKRKKTNQR